MIRLIILQYDTITYCKYNFKTFLVVAMMNIDRTALNSQIKFVSFYHRSFMKYRPNLVMSYL